MTEIDINFVKKWPKHKIDECCEWLNHYPLFGQIDVDATRGIMYFENEQDAVFFLLRWS